MTGVGGVPISSPTLTFTYSTQANPNTPLAGAPTSIGSYQVVAKFAGNLDYSTTSVTKTFNITVAPLTVTIGDASKSYGVNDAASLAGTISGVLGNDSISGSYTSAGSSATANVGTYPISASLSDNNTGRLANYSVVYTNAARSLTTGTLTINPDHTTTGVSSSLPTSTFGVGVTFSATVTDSDSTAAPTGTVEFYDGTTDLGAGTAGSVSGNAATWTLPTSSLSATTHAISAVYTPATLTGGADFLASNDKASPFSQVVNKATPTVTASAAPATYNALAYNGAGATVTGVGVGNTLAGATLTYYNSTGATISGAPVDAGSYSVVASFAGNSSYLAASSKAAAFVIAQAAPTVTASAAPATFNGATYAGELATVSGVAGATITTPAVSYTYYNASNASISGAPVDAGSYSVVANFAGNTDYLAASSKAASFVIAQAATTSTGSAATIDYGQSATLSATVKSGSLAGVGSVDFYDTTTATDLGTATLSGSGVATLVTASPLPSGTQSIVLNFLGSTDFLTSSATIGATVLPSIYVLNSTITGALSLSGSSTISIAGLVQVDSKASQAIQESGNTKITASAIRVAGGYSASGSSTFSTTPVTGAASVADPLSALPIPSATGMTTYAAVNLGGASSQTISPGIYPSINVTGSGNLTMKPGLYVITGGGFSVNGAATLTGSGVTVYNAGSNYNGGSGSTFGGFAISTSGPVNFSPMATGPYAGIALFQSRDNTRAVALSGNTAVALNGGVLYAPAALLNISGSAQLGSSKQPSSPYIVNQLQFSGTGSSDLNVDGEGSSDVSVAGQLLAGEVSVYVDNSSGNFTPDELARIQDAVKSADATVAPFGVDVTEISDPSLATTVITMSNTSEAGDASSGVLGCESDTGVTLVTGWDWFAGSDVSQIGPDQYDFETIVLHELGHVLGLGHSHDSDSVMFATLDTGEAKHELVTADLGIPDTDSGPCALHAATSAGHASLVPSAVASLLSSGSSQVAIPSQEPVIVGVVETKPARVQLPRARRLHEATRQHPFDRHLTRVDLAIELITSEKSREHSQHVDQDNHGVVRSRGRGRTEA